MFGYAAADPEKLRADEKARYRAVYCGVCRAMGKGRGGRLRIALTYDMVLLALVLSDVGEAPFTEYESRCLPHPLKPHPILENAYTSYAADMNVLLAFYNFLDDLNDNGGFLPAAQSAMFWDAAADIKRRYPALAESLSSCLKEISAAEKRDEPSADIPAGAFGRILGSVFSYHDFPCRKELFDFGSALGKAVYLMDAAVDVKSDLKKKQYNPFIRIPADERLRILELQLADCMTKLSALPLRSERGIAENILLSGIWQKYDSVVGRDPGGKEAG